MSRAWVEVDLRAIDANIRRVRSETKREVLAVVKANAYGHGLVPVAEAALQAGATWLGVALLEEAIALRDAGITEKIIAWLVPPGDVFDQALQRGIDISVPSLSIFRELLSAADKVGITPRVHIEVDTGMSRGGFLGEWSQLLEFAGANRDHFEFVGLWSHFARADEPGEVATEQQIQRYEEMLAEIKTIGILPTYTHLSNSAAALTLPKAHRDLVRLGISMYGLSPDVRTMGSSQLLSLQPAMTLKSILHLVKEVPAGSAVGYGGTAIVPRPTKLGVIPLGYSDGIPRNTSSAARVFVAGNYAPIIGRVSMDQFVVDLGIDSTAEAGDEVIVFGNGGSPVDEWAQAAGTINYEIVTRIAARVPRIYLR